MAWVGIAITAASALMQASQTAAAGRAEEKAALARQAQLDNQAEQARANAIQEEAFAQREAFNERKKGELVASRALAVGAASGVGVESLDNVFGDIGQEEEFRALDALFRGDRAAQNLRYQADLKVFEGEQEARAGQVARRLAKSKALTQVLAGAGKAASAGYTSYGGGTTATTSSGLARYGAPSGDLANGYRYR